MKITKANLYKIIKEELASVVETADSAPMMPPKPVTPSAGDLNLAIERVEELLNTGELPQHGWVNQNLREIHSILTKHTGQLEEGHYNKDPRPCANDERYQPPNRNDYRQYGKCVKK